MSGPPNPPGGGRAARRGAGAEGLRYTITWYKFWSHSSKLAFWGHMFWLVVLKRSLEDGTSHNDPRTQYRSNQKEYRTDRIERLPRFAQNNAKRANPSKKDQTRLGLAGFSLVICCCNRFFLEAVPHVH